MLSVIYQVIIRGSIANPSGGYSVVGATTIDCGTIVCFIETGNAATITIGCYTGLCYTTIDGLMHFSFVDIVTYYTSGCGMCFIS